MPKCFNVSTGWPNAALWHRTTLDLARTWSGAASERRHTLVTRVQHPACNLAAMNSNVTPPRLWYVIGASGAGKDSLIRHARQHIGDAPVVFAHRYITRPADAPGENHIALSEAEFERRLAAGCFAMHWHGNGLRYGIGAEVETWLAQGLSVVVNGSRAYLDTAMQRFPQLRPVLVRVSVERLSERLHARGRETPDEIHARVERAHRLSPLTHADVHVIDNNGPLEQAGNALLSLLTERNDPTSQNVRRA